MSKLSSLEKWRGEMEPWLAQNPPVKPPTGLPRHRMGVHLIGNREPDFQYMAALKPAAVKIVDPDPAVIRRTLGLLDPNGVCILRDHPLSEQKADMTRDPINTGKRHAAEWIAKLSSAGRFGEFGRDPRIVVCGINEPDVHNAAEEQIVYQYTKAFLESLTSAKIRALALNLSVGWPREENGRIVWDTFMPLEPIIKVGNHFLCVHEYWYPTVTQGWNSYANRIARCPMVVPIIIGECAYTRQLANLPQPWGWRGNIPAPTYAEQLWHYHDNVEPNVFAVLPFTTGYASSDWESKDTQPAHADILGRIRAYKWPATWPVGQVIEPPPPGDATLFIAPKYTEKVSGFYGSLYKNSAGVSYAHEGLDISMAAGTPIYAAADGVVAWADPTQSEQSAYGIYIRTYHPQLGICAFYAHLSRCDLKTGNAVKQGQLLGYSGNTGNSTGPHLHFEIRLMTPTGAYRTGVSAHSNARVDALAWMNGWTAAGGRVEERG